MVAIGSVDLRVLPKAHLHLHLEAGMRSATLNDLADIYGITVPTITSFGSFADFSATYTAATAVLQSRDDWDRLANEICEDHAAEGCTYLEPSFWPYLYYESIGRAEDCWELVLDVFGRAADRHGVTVRFMAAIDRVVDSPERAVKIARLASRFREDGIVSLGLHNDEVGHPPARFVDAFRVAKEAGLLCSPHAGELDGPDRVVEALDVLGADRIQHGVRAVEDETVVERLASSGVCLDVCPTSNVKLGVVPSFDAHPLGQLLEAGVSCSLNADDPLLFETTILGEYERCRSELGLDDAQLAGMARSSFEASGAPQPVRDLALNQIDDWSA